jgi:hypothetical protein
MKVHQRFRACDGRLSEFRIGRNGYLWFHAWNFYMDYE